MTRLVFQLAGSVDTHDVPHIEISLEEPSVFGSNARPFQCTGTEPAFIGLRDARPRAGATKRAGKALFDEVSKHPHIASQLSTALQTLPWGRYPVYVKLATGEGIEALPWEAMCSGDGEFLSLDERWAIGRLVDSQAFRHSFWQFTPPLRIAAVLSCLDVPAAEEWNALESAIMDAPEIEADVLVFVSEADLYDELRTTKGRGSFGLRVEKVPRELWKLQQMVREFKPNLLHFFCHGSAQDGPHIELAVRSDWIRNSSRSSVHVESSQFKDFFSATDELPWLTVLNSCETAAYSEGDNTQSLALSLVNKLGLPAVVGMREPVVSDDASIFTQAFYRRLLEDLRERVLGGTRPGDPLDWAMMLVPARASIAENHVAKHAEEHTKERTKQSLAGAFACTKEWTLPAIYMRPTQITFRLSSEAAGDAFGGGPPIEPPRLPESQTRLTIEALLGLLAHIPPGTPPEFREEAEEQLRELVDQLEE